MLFNADNQTKQRIFNQYKQDAIDYHQRKEDEKRRRIQEEREFIENNQKLVNTGVNSASRAIMSGMYFFITYLF